MFGYFFEKKITMTAGSQHLKCENLLFFSYLSYIAVNFLGFRFSVDLPKNIYSRTLWMDILTIFSDVLL